jgi:hypothetical protein
MTPEQVNERLALICDISADAVSKGKIPAPNMLTMSGALLEVVAVLADMEEPHRSELAPLREALIIRALGIANKHRGLIESANLEAHLALPLVQEQ